MAFREALNCISEHCGNGRMISDVIDLPDPDSPPAPEQRTSRNLRSLRVDRFTVTPSEWKQVLRPGDFKAYFVIQ